MNRSGSSEKGRWIIWAVTALLLYLCGRSLLHLKQMEWFMLAFALWSAGLVLAFRRLRDKQ